MLGAAQSFFCPQIATTVLTAGNGGVDLGVEVTVVSVATSPVGSSWLHKTKKSDSGVEDVFGLREKTNTLTRAAGFVTSVFAKRAACFHLHSVSTCTHLRPDKYKYMPVAPAARPLPAEARSMPIPLLMFPA